MSNVENQMCNDNKVNLLSELTSGVPPVIFVIVLIPIVGDQWIPYS